MAATLQTFQGIDILVNNAGIVRAADFLDMSEADFDEVIRVNLKGVFLVCPVALRLMTAIQCTISSAATKKGCREGISSHFADCSAAISLVCEVPVSQQRCHLIVSRVRLQCGQTVGRQMMEQNRIYEGRGGVIINMSSVNGVTAIPSIAGYNASKGGIDNLTKCASKHKSTRQGPFLGVMQWPCCLCGMSPALLSTACFYAVCYPFACAHVSGRWRWQWHRTACA